MTTQAPTIAPGSSSQGESRTQAQQYVERQLLQTGRQVMVNDIVLTLVGTLSWIVGWFVFCIVIDAWVIPLTVSMRWGALVVLLVGILGWLLYCLYPIFFRRINPAYSAVMIEKSKEKFHNSLLNYTYLKAGEREVNQHVLQVVTQKAAQDLSQVAGLERVDRSGVIRLGAMLAALVGLFVVYTIFSSKSPWVSIARICLPNADIQRPASVSIVEVQPGDTDVFFGRRLLVSCQVKGKHDPESVVVVLSTEDGRLIDVRQPMSPTGEISGSYQAELTTSPKGIDTSFRYRIEAGDGQTREYHVKVNMNPTISVDSIKIKSPAYTKIPERTLNSFSNLSGVEGARVTVSAVANLPIASASIELLNLPDTAIDRTGAVVSTVKMTAAGNQAEGEFVLTFNRRANQPDFTHFQLRFTAVSGDRNEITNVYAIRIVPDLGPEIRIVKPSEKEIRIPANRQASVEVVASDLDYALDAVKLIVEHRGATLLTDSLPFPAESDRRTFQGRFEISPEKLQLKPGDQALFFAKAADNRHAPILDIPEPNEARTENYRLIVEPPSDQPDQTQEPPSEEQGDENNQNDDQKSDNKNQDAGDNQQQGDDQSANQKNQSDNGKSNEQSEGESSDGRSGEDQGNRSKSEAKQQSAESKEQNEGQGGKNAQGAGESTDPQSNPQKENASTNASDGKNDGGEPQTRPTNQSNDGQPDGQKPKDNAQDGERDTQLKDGEQRPLDEDATDSERFERIRQMMEKQQQQKNQTNNENQKQENQRSDSNASQPPDRSNQGQDPQQSASPNKSENAENESPKTESSSENQSSEDRADKKSQEQQNRGAGDSKEQPGQEKNDGKSPGNSDEKSDESKPQTPPNPQPNAKGEETGPPANDEQDQSDQGKSQQNKSSQSRSEQNGSAGNQGKQSAGADGQEQAGDAQQGQGQAERPSDGQPTPAGSDNPSGEKDPNASSPSNSKSFDGSGSGGGDAPGGSSAPTSADQARRELSGRGFGENLPPEEREQLNFKREATDLALKYLKDQPPGPEREELLRQLNMTESQLAEFMQRWEQMAERAKTGDAKAQQQYERALRSLGLKNRRSQIKGRTERMENLSEGGAASRPPAEVEENFQQFLRNLNRLDPRRDQ